MYILGINAYHGGASAALIKNGQLIAAAEEERFKRIKYWAGFPVEAIQYCLDEEGISPYDLDHVGVSRNPSANLMRKVLFTLRRRPNIHFIRDRLTNTLNVQGLESAFAENLGLDAQNLKAEFHNVEHHQAHLASAFFVSPFEEAAVISVDGMGDFVSTMWGAGSGNHLETLGRIHFPHSLGWLYTALSQWLGFPRYGDEGKVMGLTSFGKPTCMEEMHDIIRIQDDGTFELNLDYFINHFEGSTMVWRDGAPELGTIYSQKLIDLLGPPRNPREPITDHHQNVAASLQAVLEEAEFALLDKLYQATGQKRLCMAGGVALNSVFNGKVLPNTEFEEIFIQPAAGDAGTALGAAYYIYHQTLNQPRTQVMEDAYTGPRFANGQIAYLLEEYDLTYEELSREKLLKRSVGSIVGGDVLGWFQGRMEWGPRALGNRSILADPRRADMKDILNDRIKHRESFRPFAPSILMESVGDYFEQSYPDPFMLKVYDVQPEKREAIPAVTHVDGTGRLQTVHKETNPLYWHLIKGFEDETGVPVVLNTSFNENEPIVCTPREAIDCFLRTKMNTLAIGDFFVTK